MQFLIPILSAGISAGFSALLTYIFAIKKNKRESILKFKEERYLRLIVALQGFVGNKSSNENKEKCLQEIYKSWLYASDEFLENIHKFIALFLLEISQEELNKQGKKLIGEIIFAMRKDLLGKTRLKSDAFFYVDV